MTRTTIRTRGTAAVLAALGAAAGLVATAPVAAADQNTAAGCSIEADISYNPTRHTVSSFRALVCGPEDIRDLATKLYRDGKKVAEGVGFATYNCRGTASGLFTATSALPERHPCG